MNYQILIWERSFHYFIDATKLSILSYHIFILFIILIIDQLYHSHFNKEEILTFINNNPFTYIF